MFNWVLNTPPSCKTGFVTSFYFVYFYILKINKKFYRNLPENISHYADKIKRTIHQYFMPVRQRIKQFMI